MSDDSETTSECNYQYSDEEESVSKLISEQKDIAINKLAHQSRSGANSALINSQPQDFVVVNGNTYRITRSSRIGLNDSEEKLRKIDFINDPKLSDAGKILALQHALDDANEQIIRQKKELLKKSRRIEELELRLGTISNDSSVDNPDTSRVIICDSSLENSINISDNGAMNTSNTDVYFHKVQQPNRKGSIKSTTDDPSTSYPLWNRTGPSAINTSNGSSTTHKRMTSSPSPHRSNNLNNVTTNGANSATVNNNTESTNKLRGSRQATGVMSHSFSQPDSVQQHNITTTTTLSSSSTVSPRGGDSSTTTPRSIEKDKDKERLKEPPRRLMARLNMGASERRKLGSTSNSIANSSTGNTSTNPKSNSISQPHSKSTTSSSSSHQRVPSDQLLAQTLSDLTPPSTSSNSRSKLIEETGTDSDKDRLKSNTVTSMIITTNNQKPLFTWRGEDLTLFIFHDNPQLGNNVSNFMEQNSIKDTTDNISEKKIIEKVDDQEIPLSIAGTDTDTASDTLALVDMRTCSSSSPPSAPAAAATMELMIECKGDDGLTYLVLGDVVYSGGVAGVLDADVSNPRGAQVMACRSLRGYRLDLRACPTRTLDTGIVEFNLCPTTLPADAYLPLNLSETLVSFLQQCSSRVDVILAPSRHGTWYPYWEGKRKMAPQFRSRGVGYIRLGDDMSRYGASFLSMDAGASFLDPPGTCGGSVCDYSSTTSSITTASSRPSVSTTTTSLYNTCPGFISLDREPTAHPPNYSEGSAGDQILEKETGLLKELLDKLRDEEQVKWSHRAQLLQQLQTCATSDPALLPDVLNELLGNITKQKNPHVVRAAAMAVAAVGDAVTGHAGCGGTWRSLLLETIHLLRHANKSVTEGAKESLTALHGRSISLSSLIPLLEEILGGPHGRVEGAAFNTGRVVLWLSDLADKELAYPSMTAAGVTADTDADAGQEGGAGEGGERASGSIARVFPRLDASAALTRTKPLLQHREESTRDASLALMARLLALDVVQYQHQSLLLTSNGGLNTAGGATSTTTDAGPVAGTAPPSLKASLEECVSLDAIDGLSGAGTISVGEGVRRLLSPSCRAVVESMNVTASSSSSSSTAGMASTTTQSQDQVAQKKLNRLLSETLRLLRIKEGLISASDRGDGSAALTTSMSMSSYNLRNTAGTGSKLSSSFMSASSHSLLKGSGSTGSTPAAAGSQGSNLSAALNVPQPPVVSATGRLRTASAQPPPSSLGTNSSSATPSSSSTPNTKATLRSAGTSGSKQRSSGSQPSSSSSSSRRIPLTAATTTSSSSDVLPVDPPKVIEDSSESTTTAENTNSSNSNNSNLSSPSTTLPLLSALPTTDEVASTSDVTSQGTGTNNEPSLDNTRSIKYYYNLFLQQVLPPTPAAAAASAGKAVASHSKESSGSIDADCTSVNKMTFLMKLKKLIEKSEEFLQNTNVAKTNSITIMKNGDTESNHSTTTSTTTSLSSNSNPSKDSGRGSWSSAVQILLDRLKAILELAEQDGDIENTVQPSNNNNNNNNNNNKQESDPNSKDHQLMRAETYRQIISLIQETVLLLPSE